VHIEAALGKKGTLPLRIETIKAFARVFPDSKATNGMRARARERERQANVDHTR